MDWSLVIDVGNHLVGGMPLFAAAGVVLIAARFLFSWTTPFKLTKDLVNDENNAEAVVVGAYLISVALALLGALFGRGDDGTGIAMAKILTEGLLAIGLLRTSIWIHDRLILYRFCIVKEIREDKSLGTGWSVAGSCVGSGLILNGALTGFSQDFTHGLRDIVLLWLLGQMLLVLGAFIYSRLTRYDVHELIEYDNNVAVGIGFGVLLISFGLIIRAAIVFAGVNTILAELTRAIPSALFGIAAVLTINTISARLLTSKLDYEDEVQMHGNIAVSVVTACVTLATAMLLASIIQK